MLSYYLYCLEWPEAYEYWRGSLSPIFKLGVKGEQLTSSQFLEFFLPIQATEHCLILGSGLVYKRISVPHSITGVLPH